MIMFFIKDSSNDVYFLLPSATKRPHEKEKKKGSLADTTYIDIRDGFYHRVLRGIFYKGSGDFETGHI